MMYLQALADQLSTANVEKNRAAAELELERNPMPTIVTNALGVVTLWNAKAAITTGYYREEMIGMELAEVVAGDSMKEEVRSGRSCSSLELEQLRLSITLLSLLPASQRVGSRASRLHACRARSAEGLRQHPVLCTELERRLACCVRA
jgi:hypothetical protein